MFLCSCKPEKYVPVERTDEEIYNTAMSYITQGNYELAYGAFMSIKSYDKASEALQYFQYLPGVIIEREPEDKDKKDLDVTTFTYDSVGNITLKNVTIASVSQGMENFTYDAGLLKTSTLTDINGKTTVSKYTFDGDGKLQDVFITDPNENFIKKAYKYNENGKVASETKTDIDGSIVTGVYKYGEDGKLVSKVLYKGPEGSTEMVMKYEYSYNDQGLITKATKTVGGKVSTIEYGEYKLFYMPEYRDIMLYY